MNLFQVIFLLVTSIGVFCSERRLAAVFFLLGVLYFSKGSGLQIGGTMLHSYRLLMMVGVIRVFVRNEKSGLQVQFVDKLVLAGIIWLLFANLFHEQDFGSGIIYNLGVGFEIIASYFLIRIWCRNFEDVESLTIPMVLMLIPISLSMIAEKSLHTNPMGILGGGDWINIREGVIRSRGTFSHAILAGSIAAACFPIVVSIWNQNKVISIIGGVSAISMILTCNSSGPLVSFVVTCAILAGWKFRNYVKQVVWCGILGYIAIDLISNRPGYHAIVTRLDLTGSSTAYYRCLLIDTAVDHLNEWWLIGTDFTAHWIQPGLGSIILGGKHMDITNMYIGAGVSGGLMSVLLLFGVIVAAVRNAVLMSTDDDLIESKNARFSIWCYGAAVGSIAVSGISTSFFDQSGTFIWIFSAIISSSLEGFRAADYSEQPMTEDSLESESLPEKWIAEFNPSENYMEPRGN